MTGGRTGKLPDWEQRLSEYIESVRDTPFVWGEHDCCTNFFDAALAMTGTDLWHDFRGRYSTELGAFRALKRYGNGDIEPTLDARCEAIPVGFAQRGDGIWNGESVGICMGSYALFLAAPDSDEGMVRVPRSEWVKGWRAWAS